jgi:threonine synthase
MNYYSLKGQSPIVDFKEATIRGQAPDKGLYFPEQIPVHSDDFFKNLKNSSPVDICFKVIQPFVGDCIPEEKLLQIVAETIHFPIPLVKLNEDIFILEMFHGNTLAFKDIGARFMSRCLGYFVKDIQRRVTVLVATSGDTGGAVADGFYGVEGIDVVILYPSGKVSHVQEKQLTTLGNNIKALEVNGTFDDCQRLVKTAFADAELNEQLFLTSANSINVARWLPQQFFYYMAVREWQEEQAPVICVPSGNFGNICSGLLAMQSGLPVKHFIAACNANKVVPEFMRTGHYQPLPTIPTISNAMDVGDPSNFIRILQLFHEKGNLASVLSSDSITDEATREAIKKVFSEKNYLMDPHGAVGYVALQHYLQQHEGQKGIFAETAHPVKFFDVVEPVIEQAIAIPPAIERILPLPKESVLLENDFTLLKSYLMETLA